MSVLRVKYGLLVGAIATAAMALTGISTALGATPPIKETLSSHVGWEVNKATKGTICPVEPTSECQPGVESGEPGGFLFPGGLSIDTDATSPHSGDVYVADTGNARVQELSPTGQFVAMFGWDVNETKEKEAGATQAAKNVCTEAEIKSAGVKCKPGVSGSAVGQFENMAHIAVSREGDHVYIAETNFGTVGEEFVLGERIQEFTADGQFVLEMGKEVNHTSKANVCTAAEEKLGDICGAPTEHSPGGPAEIGPNLFNSIGALAVGGPKDLLYVGEEFRVQEIEADGKYVGEIPLTSISVEAGSIATTLTVDGTGDVYLVYSVGEVANKIREFDPSNTEIKTFEVPSRFPNATLTVRRIALDPAGRLAVTEDEEGSFEGIFRAHRGSMYEIGASKLRRTTEFVNEFPTEFGPYKNTEIAFNGNGDLYGLAPEHGEITVYTHSTVADLVSKAATCAQGSGRESDVTFDCALAGEVNPWGVAETEAWFESGRTVRLNESTQKQCVANCAAGVETPIPVSASVTVPPNATLYYRLAGSDHNVKPPETPLSSETESFATPIVPPEVFSRPQAQFVQSSSAVLFGELNPEHTETEYYFEYGPCSDISSCATKTRVSKSSAYGAIGATLEITGLQPSTVYHYRLVVVNEKSEAALNGKGERETPESSFTTAPRPVPRATTGAANAVTATSAVVTGAVDPDGQPATYEFELGVYNPAGTQFGVAFSGSTGASAGPFEESLGLYGLQPGTNYAYRIKIESGYGIAVGGIGTFTTAGLPSVLVTPIVPPMLAVPAISFPQNITPCKHGYQRDKRGLCVKAKKKSKSKSKRKKKKSAHKK